MSEQATAIHINIEGKLVCLENINFRFFHSIYSISQKVVQKEGNVHEQNIFLVISKRLLENHLGGESHAFISTSFDKIIQCIRYK